MGTGFPERRRQPGTQTVPIAPPPTTRGNSAGPDAGLCLELRAGSVLPLLAPNTAAPRPSCKVTLLGRGWQAHKTHFGNKVPPRGVLLRLKASGRKRTHPLACHHRGTRVPEREIPDPPVPIKTGGSVFSGSGSHRTLSSTPLLRCFLIRCSLGGLGSPWWLHGCCANRIRPEAPRDTAGSEPLGGSASQVS